MTRECPGDYHVIAVPRGMTPAEAWAETTVLGKLAEPDPHCTWAGVKCEGGPDCSCFGVEQASNYRRYEDDVLVEARAFGMRVPRPLLRFLR